MQSYPERADVRGGFHSNHAEATPDSLFIEMQDLQVKSGVAPENAPSFNLSELNRLFLLLIG